MKKFALLLAIICSLGIFTLTACNDSGDSPTAPEATSFITLDINPTVELVLDQNDTVMSVAGVNSDGQVLLYGEGGIVGAKAGVALQKILSLFSCYGYLSAGDDTVFITAYTSDSDRDIYNDVEQLLLEANPELDIQRAINLVLKTELEENGYAVSLERYNLISRVAKVRGCDVSDLINASDATLLNAVKEADSNSSTKLGTIYDRTVSEARFALASARQTAKDGLYALHFTNKTINALVDGKFFRLFSSTKSLFFANVYTVLHSTAFNLEHYYLSIKKYLANPVFTADDFKDAFTKVADFFKDMTEDIFGDEIADESGEITRDSVNAYMNALYRSLPEEERESFEAVYKEIKTDVLDNVSAADAIDSEMIKAQLSEIKEKIASALSEAGDTIIEWLNLIDEDFALGDRIVDALGQARSAVNSFIEWLGLDQIDFRSLLDVENIIAKLNNATEDAYDAMGITGEDEQEIALLEENIADTLNEAKRVFDETVSSAKQTASEWLESAKEFLKGNKTE